MAFVEASHQASVAEEQACEVARQRELEQAQQLAEAQQLRLEQQQRAARKLRKMIGGLAVVAIVAVCACVAALVANRRASDLALIAEQKSEIAEASAADADRERTNAEQALTQVESQKAAVVSSLTKAEAAEQVARAAEEAGRKLLYTTDMQLAPFVWRDDRATAEQLRVLLAKHVPDGEAAGINDEIAAVAKPDLRGFEWHYYQHLLESSSDVFPGHGASVEGAAFTSDGQLVTLDLNAHVRRWDLESQQEDRAGRRDLPRGPVAQVRILSPNGRLSALAEDNTVHVFETSSGKDIFQFYSAYSPVRRLAFTRDNDKLVVVDDKIRWCSAVTGEVLASLDQKFDRIETLALSGDGLTLAVVGHGSLGQLFSIYRLDATEKNVTHLATHASVGGTLHASALSPDGQRISIGASLSGVLYVFDTATGRAVAKHSSAHASPVAVIAFSSDGSKLATADTAGTIKIWADVEKLNSKSAALLTLKGHQGSVNTIGFSDDGKRLMTTSVDKTARVWNLENPGAAIQPLESSSDKNNSMTRFSPDGQLVAVADNGSSSVGLWDAVTGQLVRELSATDQVSIHSVAFSPTDHRLLAVGYGGKADVSYVALWDIDAGIELARLSGATDLPEFQLDENNGAVGALAFSPDGKHLVAGFGSRNMLNPGSFPSPLKVWDVATRRLIRRLKGHMNYCVSLDFSRDGKKLASSSHDGTAMLWSTDTWKATHTMANPDQGSLFQRMVEAVAFSPDGKLLALASRGGTVQLWNADGGKLIESLKGHSSAVSTVVFSPDGRTLASGSSDQTVRLWNVETRRELMQLDSGSVALGGVLSLAFSADGTRLMAGGDAIAFWSTVADDSNNPDQAAEKLKLLLHSGADFQSRLRMISENLGLHAALEKLDSNDVRVAAAVAAMQANWYASRQAWPEAAAAYDRLLAADPVAPDAWFRTPGLLRLATALLHQDRPAVAAAVLQAGSKRAGQDPANASAVGFGVVFSAHDGRVLIQNVVPGSPAARSKLLASDAILQVNGVDTANLTLADVSKMLQGEVGMKVRLTVRHPGNTETEFVDLVKAKYLIVDALTAGSFSTMQALLEERLAKAPQDARFLELRAELAGVEYDFTSQVANYTAAIEALNGQTTEGAVADLQRLYGRRGNVHIALGQWPQAVEDFARSVTAATTDEALLSNQALALAQSSRIEMKPPEHFVLFGKTNESNGIRLVDAVGDGLTELATVDGQECRMAQTNAEGSNGSSYIYFAVDESFKRTPMMNARVEIEYKAIGSGNLQFQYDSPNTAYATSPETVLLEKSTEWKTASFTLKDARLANSQNGQADFRFLLFNTGRFYFRRISARQVLPGAESRDPWVQLAGIYRIRNELESLDKLVEGHPGSTAAIGDLFAADQEWQRAIEIYSRAITAETTDIDLLSKRALAWEGIQNWEAAAADWSRAATEYPDGAKLLAEFARRLAVADQVPLSNSQFEQSQAFFEKSLHEDPENELLAAQLADVLLTSKTRWTILEPIEMTSQGVETFTVENDGSIFVSGLNPDRAVYTLKLRTDLPSLTAIRLETIPDTRLPDGGAGRFASNGNFHVAEFSAAIESGQADVEPIPIDFFSAITDFAGYPQSPLEIIDGNPLTIWDTVGRVKDAHWAVFGLKSPARIDGGTVSITLDSGITSWGKHGLGRFRLSVSDDPSAFEREQKRMSVLKLTDPWQRLAAAYFVVGEQPALDKLLEQHPEVVAGIGDLYAMIEDWDRAIAEYNKLITSETRDATLLAKRATAHEKLQKWDMATADWALASQQQPDVAFKNLRSDSAPSWGLDQHHGAACSMTAIDGTMVFKTTVATGTNWHVQAYQGQLQLENGVEYVIRFKMKSTNSCTVTLFGAINQDDWHGIGLNETFVPPSEFQDYEFTFVPHDLIPGNNRIGFQLGTNQGEVIVKEIVILTKRDGGALHEAGLLAKLATEHVSTQNWDLAQAEWRQAVAQQPDLMQIAFDQFKNARRWSEAAEFGLKLVEQQPNDTLAWLRIAPVLALGEEHTVYSEFCGRMAQHFAESKDAETAERVTKASLLLAKTIDIVKFHGEIFAKLLDEGTVPDSFLPWGWGTRALLAYRSGDSESAVKYVAKSEEYKPVEVAHAMNLLVRAMAQHQLGQADETGRTLEEASQLVIRLMADPSQKGDHNLLIAEILFHEAVALMNGREQPKEPDSEAK